MYIFVRPFVRSRTKRKFIRKFIRRRTFRLRYRLGRLRCPGIGPWRFLGRIRRRIMGRDRCLGSRCARRGGNFGEFIRKDKFRIFDGSFSLQLGGPGALQHGRHHGPYGGRQGLSEDSGSDPLDASRKDPPFFQRKAKRNKAKQSETKRNETKSLSVSSREHRLTFGRALIDDLLFPSFIFRPDCRVTRESSVRFEPSAYSQRRRSSEKVINAKAEMRS